jgi:hypothetical protein
MSLLTVDIYADFAEFRREYPAAETDARMLWDLLGQISTDELMIKLPEWLAEKKVGYVDGSVPTEFVGKIEEETDEAIKFTDASAARPLMKLAHRIDRLEQNENEHDQDDWSQRRLQDHRQKFKEREDAEKLQDEWIPKSQLSHVVKRREKRGIS